MKLTQNEGRRIEKTLKDRFKEHHNVIDAIVGEAIRGYSIDRRRPLAARIYVRKKAGACIGPRITRSIDVRLKRGRHFETLTFPTDVVEANTAMGLEELTQVHRSLRKQFSGKDIFNLSFGVSRKSGRLDFDRGIVIRVTVRRKWRERTRSRERSNRIPREVIVRLKRGSRFVAIPFRTDVISRRKFVRTGCRFDSADVPRTTTGVVFTWLERSSSSDERKWGLLTVRHAFERVSIGDQVRIRKRQSTDQDIIGTLLARTNQLSMDGAIISVAEKADLVRAGILPANFPQSRLTNNIPFWKRQQLLVINRRKRGKSLCFDQVVDFDFEAFTPVHEEAENLEFAIEVSGAARAFRGGRSGALWTLDGAPAAIQVAGKTPDFEIGVGQAIFRLYDWAEIELRRRSSYVRDSIRLVQIF